MSYDARFIALQKQKIFEKIDRFKMVGFIGQETFPINFSVCPVCRGRGTHVNPSIDSHGLSREDFENDPDFAEDYFSGVYDVVCYECDGANVVAEVLWDSLSERKKEIINERIEYTQPDLDYLSERRRGA